LNLLLDTHLLLWTAFRGGKLSLAATTHLDDERNELWFSTVSIWEVAIKSARGGVDFDVDPMTLQSTLVSAGYRELPLKSAHTYKLSGLPSIHKDPFDRILIAQALVEGLTLLTSDKKVARYPGSIILV
jgi:PIN domain nuclease of toxin-antitoxin system